MLSFELRKKFLDFFKKRGHTIVPSSSLLPTDSSVLFTTAGMQQFKPYYLEEKSPYGSNIVSCQKCFRTSDIEEIGDERHLTFLEMLGNFSFGSYFKEEAIKLAHEFLFKELKLSLNSAIFTVFEGDKYVPEDKESIKIWKKLGIPENKIKKCGREDNFWGPTGDRGPCGPTTEIYLNGTEIWNLVFNEYYQDKNKKLTLLSQKGVDTGMGLERLFMTVQGKKSVYENDLFSSIINEILSGNEKQKRIIADHIKGSVFLASEGVLPSNMGQGYILRRLLRRVVRYGKILKMPTGFISPLVKQVVEIYKNTYSELKLKEAEILAVIQNEEEKFEKTLDRGLKRFEKIIVKGDISGENAFHLYDTYGFPIELTIEMAKEKKIKVDEKGFQRFFEKHKEISRAGVESKFGGVGKGATYEATKLHTATHLLHQALRIVLGDRIKQMGCDITPQRIRFDFSYPTRITKEELRQVEEIINQKIKEDLEVKKEEMTYQEAVKAGALIFFKAKYPEKVTVYSINNFSKEICAGPHINRISELGRFIIIKEESSSAGVRRIRAILK